MRPQRLSRRRAPDRRGASLDVRRMIRRSLRTGGDPVDRPLRARKDVKLTGVVTASGLTARCTRSIASN